jgi:hypothetical protein
LRRKNLGGIAPQKLSPLHDLEPLLVEWSLKMAKIGQALSRANVLELASKLIEGTEFEEKVKTFKAKRNIKYENHEGKVILGKRWYQSFMRRHADELKSKKCKIKDIKRHTWCTYEHFSNMYDGAYEGMVEAGVGHGRSVHSQQGLV